MIKSELFPVYNYNNKDFPMNIKNNIIMKTSVRILVLLSVLFSLSAGTSCSPEDGEDGAMGEQGVPGQDGMDGEAGEDGNANVRTLLFDISERSGLNFEIAVPEFTQAVINNDAILWYVEESNITYPIPGAGPNAAYVIRVFATVGNTRLNFNNWDGTSFMLPVGGLDELKIVIIESTSGSSTGKSSKEDVFEELKNAGVDINNYEEVIAYYNN